MTVYLLFEYTPLGKSLIDVFATRSSAENDKNILESVEDPYIYHIEEWTVLT